ncbi:hypothetical protein LCGC14_1493530 [marine sediment metagenome]|uniref:Uncharacterized protein n=2 Tax=root TaxID=1 RepID=A0A831VMW1_9FLAO|nr:hypothetical protein [Pricia antarctica]
MKGYRVYRDIRKRALIFGLPIPLFALQMLKVIGSLLVVIFSFSFLLVMGALAVNLSLYAVLLKLTHSPQILNVAKVFPSAISNKKTTDLSYED